MRDYDEQVQDPGDRSQKLGSDRIETLLHAAGIAQIVGVAGLRIIAADLSEQRDLRTTRSKRSCDPLRNPSTVVGNHD